MQNRHGAAKYIGSLCKIDMVLAMLYSSDAPCERGAPIWEGLSLIQACQQLDCSTEVSLEKGIALQLLGWEGLVVEKTKQVTTK